MAVLILLLAFRTEKVIHVVHSAGPESGITISGDGPVLSAHMNRIASLSYVLAYCAGFDKKLLPPELSENEFSDTASAW